MLHLQSEAITMPVVYGRGHIMNKRSGRVTL